MTLPCPRCLNGQLATGDKEDPLICIQCGGVPTRDELVALGVPLPPRSPLIADDELARVEYATACVECGARLTPGRISTTGRCRRCFLALGGVR